MRVFPEGCHLRRADGFTQPTSEQPSLQDRRAMALAAPSNPRIETGDLVIVYEDYRNLHAVRVAPPESFACRHGRLSHAGMIGKRFGERVTLLGGGGYIYLLSPSPELWTATLPHRTQILYIADIAMICMQLELRPGSICVEAGTGSGSLSHALARAVGADGHLHTFEFNAHRADLAAGEFAANGLNGRVTSLHGDVCADGWEYANLAPGSVDAAIFDLPQPWDAVRRIAPYMAPCARLCCFSPCIEQVARTQEALSECGFTGIDVIEAIVRTHAVNPQPAGQATSGLALVLVQAEKAAQQEALREAAAATTVPSEAGMHGEGAAPPGELLDRSVSDGGEPNSKRARHKDPLPATAAAKSAHTAVAAAASAAAGAPPQLLTKPYSDMRGHTGFLLFCSKHVG